MFFWQPLTKKYTNHQLEIIDNSFSIHSIDAIKFCKVFLVIN